MGISSAKDARLKNSYGGSNPIWITPFGFLGNIYDRSRTSSSFSLSAIDPEGRVVYYSLISGSLPPSMTLTSGGVINGTTSSVSSDTTYSFTIRATDGMSFSDRDFNIIVKAPVITQYTNTGNSSFLPPTGVSNIWFLLIAGGGGGAFTGSGAS